MSTASVSWDPPAVLPDHYLLYRAPDPRGFSDLASVGAHAEVYPPATSWTDPEPLSGYGERYYLLRSSDSTELDLSRTSNTAGVFFGVLAPGLTAISTPLEYFPWVDYSGHLEEVALYRTAQAPHFAAYFCRLLEGSVPRLERVEIYHFGRRIDVEPPSTFMRMAYDFSCLETLP